MNERGREVLDTIISNVDILPRPDPLDTNSSREQQLCQLHSPLGIFTLEMCEPVCETERLT
jgi:hypothetical protein